MILNLHNVGSLQEGEPWWAKEDAITPKDTIASWYGEL